MVLMDLVLCSSLRMQVHWRLALLVSACADSTISSLCRPRLPHSSAERVTRADHVGLEGKIEPIDLSHEQGAIIWAVDFDRVDHLGSELPRWSS